MLGYATRYYADNYEEVHSGDNVYYYYYIHTPDGLTNVAEKKNSTITVYSAETDYLGSIVAMYNYKGQTVFRAEYDAWGKQNVVTDNLARFQRGYCGHEHWQEFGLIDMNGRMYDPVIARFLSPDPFVQAPEDLQNYNRYTYCLNNPLKYTDPSGESIIAAAIIGAVVGAYIGGSYANKSYNPGKWEWNSSDTWNNMFWGSVVGGISGALGGAVAASGMPFANTASITCSSLYSSVGTSLYTGGETPVSISLGFASYDFSNNEWGYLGKKGNKKVENFCYGLGAMANLGDILVGLHPEQVDLVTEHSDGIGHSAIVEHDTWTGTRGANGNPLEKDPHGIISVGPNRFKDPMGNWLNMKGTNYWDTHSRKGEKIWRETLNVNNKTMTKYSDWLNTRTGVESLTYSVCFSNCVNHASIALNLSGVFNIGIHPFALQTQMYLRNLGLRPSLFSYNGLNNK